MKRKPGETEIANKESTSDYKPSEKRKKLPSSKNEPRSFAFLCSTVNKILSSDEKPSSSQLHKSRMKQLRSRVKKQTKTKQKLQHLRCGHVLPSNENYDKVLEREIAIVATSSVVQLFAQIKKYQKENGTDERERKFKKKRAFEQRKKSLFTSKKTRDTEENLNPPRKWAALSDKVVGIET